LINENRRERGLTLIEIVVTLAILGIVAGVVGRPLISLIESRTTIGEAASRQADIDYALARMVSEIRLSSDTETVECPAPPPTDDTVLSIGDSEYSLNSSNGQALLLNDEVLLKNVGDFSCEELDSSLRLYQLEIEVPERSDIYSVRAFKRVPQ